MFVFTPQATTLEVIGVSPILKKKIAATVKANISYPSYISRLSFTGEERRANEDDGLQGYFNTLNGLVVTGVIPPGGFNSHLNGQSSGMILQTTRIDLEAYFPNWGFMLTLAPNYVSCSPLTECCQAPIDYDEYRQERRCATCRELKASSLGYWKLDLSIVEDNDVDPLDAIEEACVDGLNSAWGPHDVDPFTGVLAGAELARIVASVWEDAFGKKK